VPRALRLQLPLPDGRAGHLDAIEALGYGPSRNGPAFRPHEGIRDASCRSKIFSKACIDDQSSARFSQHATSEADQLRAERFNRDMANARRATSTGVSSRSATTSDGDYRSTTLRDKSTMKPTPSESKTCRRVWRSIASASRPASAATTRRPHPARALRGIERYAIPEEELQMLIDASRWTLAKRVSDVRSAQGLLQSRRSVVANVRAIFGFSDPIAFSVPTISASRSSSETCETCAKMPSI